MKGAALRRLMCFNSKQIPGRQTVTALPHALPVAHLLLGSVVLLAHTAVVFAVRRHARSLQNCPLSVAQSGWDDRHWADVILQTPHAMAVRRVTQLRFSAHYAGRLKVHLVLVQDMRLLFAVQCYLYVMHMPMQRLMIYFARFMDCKCLVFGQSINSDIHCRRNHHSH